MSLFGVYIYICFSATVRGTGLCFQQSYPVVAITVRYQPVPEYLSIDPNQETICVNGYSAVCSDSAAALRVCADIGFHADSRARCFRRVSEQLLVRLTK